MDTFTNIEVINYKENIATLTNSKLFNTMALEKCHIGKKSFKLIGEWESSNIIRIETQMAWLKEFKKLGKKLSNCMQIEMIDWFLKVSHLLKLKRTKWTQLKILSMMIIMSEKYVYSKCLVNLKKILNKCQNNRSQKWRWTFQKKKLSLSIIWIKDKFSLLEKSIQEIRLWD